MLESGERVLSAVSGGADSVCLALVLHRLGFEIAIAHLNHGLRGPASDRDETFTKRFAQELGVPFFSRTVSIQPEDGNVEAAGRAARKAFLAEIGRTQGFSKIAVAHTRDDRLETFLMNLLRGSGSEGLVSMLPVVGGIVRPLIETTRIEVESYLTACDQEWCTDESNFDLRLARNRLRHEVIPDLAKRFNQRLPETLSKTIEILQEEDAWMRSIAGQWVLENATTRAGQVEFDSKALSSQPVGLVRRVLREALRAAGSSLEDVSFEHIEVARSLLRGDKSGKQVEIPGGLVVARDFNRMSIRSAAPAAPDYDYELKVPGRTFVPEVGKVFSAEIVDKQGNQSGSQRVFVDAGSIGPYVRIRNWKPGDYYRPLGLPPGKLKKLFQRARIPRSQRKSWPVLVADSTIIWVASFPVSREFAPCGRSQKVVVFEALPS
jgi:tRNA(Ile)-lysidine synthase